MEIELKYLLTSGCTISGLPMIPTLIYGTLRAILDDTQCFALPSSWFAIEAVYLVPGNIQHRKILRSVSPNDHAAARLVKTWRFFFNT